jgi:hypothetical protein
VKRLAMVLVLSLAILSGCISGDSEVNIENHPDGLNSSGVVDGYTFNDIIDYSVENLNSKESFTVDTYKEIYFITLWGKKVKVNYQKERVHKYRYFKRFTVQTYFDDSEEWTRVEFMGLGRGSKVPEFLSSNFTKKSSFNIKSWISPSDIDSISLNATGKDGDVITYKGEAIIGTGSSKEKNVVFKITEDGVFREFYIVGDKKISAYEISSTEVIRPEWAS